MSNQLSMAQSGLIYLRLRGRRSLNIVFSTLNRKGQGKDGRRKANAGKAKSGFLVLFGILYLVGIMFSVSWGGASSLKKNFPDPAIFVQVFAYKFMFQVFFMGLINLASRELAKTDSDIEWLSTLPAPWPVLLLGKIIERSFLNLWFPILAATLIGGKYLSGMNIGLAMASSLALILPLLFSSAIIQIFCEYTLRLNLTPNRLRNTQATLAIIAVVPIFLTMTTSSGGNSVWEWALHHVPPIFLYAAPAIAVRLGMDPGLNLPFALAAYAAQILSIYGLSAWGLSLILKRGAVETGQRESARHFKRIEERAGFSLALARFFNPIVRREFTLLARDRSYLVQTFALPLLILGAQIYPFLTGKPAGGEESFMLPTMIFFSLSYMLAFSSFQTLNSEGQALWLIFGLPTSLERVLKQKLAMWTRITMVLVFAVLAFVHFGHHVPSTKRQIFQDGAIILGTITYGWIALALAVFGSNPMADDVQKRLKPSTMIFYLGLVSVYIPVFHVDSYWVAFVLMILIATLGYALWQEAKDYLPYLLDPVSVPPSRVSLAHGSVAVVVFFFLQIVIAALAFTRVADSGLMLLSYSAAGAIAFASMKLYFAKKKTRDLPSFFDEKWKKNLSVGLGTGATLGGFGLAYLHLNLKFGWFPLPKFEGGLREFSILVPLAVIAAPIFEEYIFRGLVFQGLKRSFQPALAGVASALIFAAVHPPWSFVPVFALGFTNAILYDRTKHLTASMATHAIYNAIVLIVPLIWPAFFH